MKHFPLYSILFLLLLTTPASAFVLNSSSGSGSGGSITISAGAPSSYYSSSSSSSSSSGTFVGGPLNGVSSTNYSSPNYSNPVMTFDFIDTSGKPAMQTINLNNNTTSVTHQNGQTDTYFYYNGSLHSTPQNTVTTTFQIAGTSTSKPINITDDNGFPATMVVDSNHKTATIYHSDGSTSTVGIEINNGKISLTTHGEVTTLNLNELANITTPTSGTVQIAQSIASVINNPSSNVITPSNPNSYVVNSAAATTVGDYYNQYTNDALKHQYGNFNYLGTDVYDYSEAGTLSNCSVFATVWVNSQGTKANIGQVNGNSVVGAMGNAGYRTTTNGQYSLNDIKVGDVVSYSSQTQNSTGYTIGSFNHVAVISDITYNPDGSIATITTANARTHNASSKGPTYQETYTGDDYQRLYNIGAIDIGCVE